MKLFMLLYMLEGYFKLGEFMAFTLLSGQTIYREKTHTGEGYWLDGVYYQGEQTVIYEPLSDVFVEPYDRQESEILPDGIRTNDARWVLCGHQLNTYRENNDNASFADRIYLRNPEVGKKAQAYLVFDLEDWDTYGDMTMVDEGYNYVIVKEGKV